MKINRCSEEFELIKEIIELFYVLGMDRQYVQMLWKTASGEARTRSPRKTAWKSLPYDNIVAATSALYVWHREKIFLNSKAEPMPLPLSGNPSVESLIRAADANVDAKSLAREMLSLNYLRKTKSGTYLPKAIYAQLKPLRPLGAAHCLYSLRSMVWNFHSNLTSKDKDPWLERNAMVTELSKADIKAFKDFARQQGHSVMATLSEWLERKKPANDIHNRLKSRRTKGVRAGVHIFAYARERN